MTESNSSDAVFVWRLKEIMTDLNITQYALQKESGIAINTIRSIYNGKTERPDLTVMNRIVHALRNISGQPLMLGDLLEYSPDNIPPEGITYTNSLGVEGVYGSAFLHEMVTLLVEKGYITPEEANYAADTAKENAIKRLEELNNKVEYYNSWREVILAIENENHSLQMGNVGKRGKE